MSFIKGREGNISACFKQGGLADLGKQKWNLHSSAASCNRRAAQLQGAVPVKLHGVDLHGQVEVNQSINFSSGDMQLEGNAPV